MVFDCGTARQWHYRDFGRIRQWRLHQQVRTTTTCVAATLAIDVICRNYPNTDPAYEGGAAEPTFEVYPPTPGFTPQLVNFVVNTSGLNSYPHMFLMPSGKMFAQANYSTSTS